MLTTLVDQVSKLIGSVYLVSALTPWMLFWVANAAMAIVLVGPMAVLRVWEDGIGKSTFAVSVLTLLIILFLVLGALLVASLTTVFKVILQGRLLTPPFGLLFRPALEKAQRQVREYEMRSKETFQAWVDARKARDEVRARLPNAYKAGQDNPLPARNDVERIAAEFETALGTGDEISRLLDAVAVLEAAYGTYSPPSFENLHDRLITLAEERADDRGADYAAIERERTETFADVRQVAPTDYGNALAAADYYVSRVYGIESAVLWTRLQKVVSTEFMEVVRDAKVRLDFFTAMTMFAVLFAIGWFLLLPHVLPGIRPVAIFTVIAVIIMLIFYRAAVEAAYGFAQVFRACFDLFRRDLLKALSIEPPVSLAEEREIWTKLSRLMVFDISPGGDDDLALLPVANGAAEKPAPRSTARPE